MSGLSLEVITFDAHHIPLSSLTPFRISRFYQEQRGDQVLETDMMRRSTHGESGNRRDSAYEYASTGSNDDEPQGVEHHDNEGGEGYRDNMFDSEVEGGMAGAVASVEAAQEAWGDEGDEEHNHHRGMDQHPSHYDLNEGGSEYRGEMMEHDDGGKGGDDEDPNSPHALMQYGQYEEDGVRVYGEEEEGNEHDGSLLPPPVDRHEEYDDPPFYKTMTGRIVICVVLIGIALCLMVIGIVQPWNKNNGGAGVQNAPTRAPTRKSLFAESGNTLITAMFGFWW